MADSGEHKGAFFYLFFKEKKVFFVLVILIHDEGEGPTQPSALWKFWLSR